MKNPVRILSIAGADSGGGAGIQADIKTVTALGGYAMRARAVLVKGGHLAGESVTHVLVDEAGVHRFSGSRIESSSTHGTGCTLASAIAMGLGQGLSLQEAILRARGFVRHAMRTGLPF